MRSAAGSRRSTSSSISAYLSSAAAPQDSRFHFSVTLGGIGNVSNIFGALGGTNPR